MFGSDSQRSGLYMWEVSVSVLKTRYRLPFIISGAAEANRRLKELLRLNPIGRASADGA